MRPEDLKTEQLRNFVSDMNHRLNVHETMWFNEVCHQFSFDRALRAMDYVWPKLQEISAKRLAEFESTDPDKMDGEGLLKYSDCIAKNWLAQDGLWFQSIEFIDGMNDAKRCNDSVWQKFSPFEAHSIKNFLNMDEYPGLEGLREALNFRMYSRLNKQSSEIVNEKLIFTMNDCRVQSARSKKGLADYPCKSAGLVEYGMFAKYIDARIETECHCCPPDEHGQNEYCKWGFFLKQ